MPDHGLRWTKASSSHGTGACVEVAADGDLIALRHSRHPEVVIHYSRTEFAAFVDGAKGGEFDQLIGPDPS